MEVFLISVGIDVSKAQLDVEIRPSGEKQSFANDKVGIKALVKWLAKIAPTLIVLEATGGYERQVTRALVSARSETSLKPPDNWPRPTASMPASWRTSLR